MTGEDSVHLQIILTKISRFMGVNGTLCRIGGRSGNVISTSCLLPFYRKDAAHSLWLLAK